MTSAVVAGGATTTYTYDDDGNQITDGAKTMVYDLENRLKSHTSGATTTTYTYDGTDKRLTRATNGTVDRKFSWDTVGGLPELALERDGTGALVRRYVQGPIGPVSMATGAGVYWYHTDPLGSVRAVTDSTGIEQWRYDFDPHGEARAVTQAQAGDPVNPVQFTGEYFDAESGLYRLRARQYDPSTGRFDALDPVDGPMTDPYTGSTSTLAIHPCFGSTRPGSASSVSVPPHRGPPIRRAAHSRLIFHRWDRERRMERRKEHVSRCQPSGDHCQGDLFHRVLRGAPSGRGGEACRLGGETIRQILRERQLDRAR